MASASPAGLGGDPAAPRGRFHPLLRVPGIDGYGDWYTFTWDNDGSMQHGVTLVPAAPTWRQLFAALDDVGASRSDPAPGTLDEADAITACCWRYGSYFHVLTGGVRHPAFRTDRSLSRLGDLEMRRINIEVSAALASWLATRAEDPGRIARRVGAALALLPMPWRAARPPGWDDLLRSVAGEQAARLQGLVEQGAAERPVRDSDSPTALRREANWAVAGCWRNGLIEDFHAGRWSLGSEVPGFLRLYAREVARLERQVSGRFADYLFLRSMLSSEVRRALPAAAPCNWTLTEETSPVSFPGMPDAGPVAPRLRQLAERYPHHFGGEVHASP